MQVYLVPLQEERNDIAKTISMHDPWYQRHVFAAFANGLNVAPRFTASNALPLDIAFELKIRDVLPVQRLQSLLQDYTRIATQELPIVAFECQCWTPGGALVPPVTTTAGGGSLRSFGGRNSAGASSLTATITTADAAAAGAGGDDDDVTSAPDLVIPFVTSAQIGLMVDVQLFRKSRSESQALQAKGQGQGDSGAAAAKGNSLKDVFKDESFAQNLMPWKPKDLIVVASPPTMHDSTNNGGGNGGNGGGRGGSKDAAAGKDVGGGGSSGVGVGKQQQLKVQDVGGKDGEHAPSALEVGDPGEVLEGNALLPKKYTTLLFTNVAGCVSDEVLAEELECIEADKVKALTGDPIFGNTPTQRDLKMHVREWDGPKAGKSKELLSQRSLKSGGFTSRGDPAEQLVAALRDEIKGADAVQKQVGTVSIEAAEVKDLFGIMLDGVVHGPFKRVVITPMYLDEETGELAKVPFMTFLPQTF
mmetsp:Transcript_8916/g.17339  ORF Transcript_8916/g.17339 Transcript_8916/m.17339 type:complete len:475 (+) Transcript_8916:1265-2689(+)